MFSMSTTTNWNFVRKLLNGAPLSSVRGLNNRFVQNYGYDHEAHTKVYGLYDENGEYVRECRHLDEALTWLGQ